jgi:hypothetical protein
MLHTFEDPRTYVSAELYNVHNSVTSQIITATILTLTGSPVLAPSTILILITTPTPFSVLQT